VNADRDNTLLTETASGISAVRAVRVPSNGYLSAIFLLLFIAAFLIYLEQDAWALAVFILALLVVPSLLLMDKFVFDGQKIYRTGIFPKLWARLNGQELVLRLDEIRQVETFAFRTMKSGGTVLYKYRTVIRGNKQDFVILSSNSEGYRKFFKSFISSLPSEILDLRTLELREFLSDPRRLKIEAERLGLPSDEFLENSIEGIKSANGRKKSDKSDLQTSEMNKAERLRRLGNQLKIAGHLLQALEAFRRSLFLQPKDPRLLFDYARCLYSFADSERNQRLKMRAIAALRLASMRSNGDVELVTSIAEAHFQYGNLRYARKLFQQAIESTRENFRAAYGLAEVALKEGKLKQVVYYFSLASRFAKRESLKNWAEKEATYFLRLDTDDDYAEKEINRINWFNHMLLGKKIALKSAFVGFLMILFGLFSNESLMDFGWTISMLSLLCWLGFNISNSFLTERTP